METINNEPDLRNEARDAVSAYIKAINLVSNSGEIIGHVHHFLGDDLYEFQNACMSMLTSLACGDLHLKVSKKIGGHCYKKLVLMLARTHNFCEMMNIENHQAEFTLYEIDNLQQMTPEQYSDITQAYKTKIKGVRQPSAFLKESILKSNAQ